MTEIDVQVNDTDPLSWNDLLSKSRPDIYNIYQTREWAILRKRADGLIPIFIRIEDRSELCGGQLYFKMRTFKALAAYSSLGGPICANGQSEKLTASIVHNMLANGRHSLYIRARPGIASASKEEFIKNKFTNFPVHFILVSIEHDEDELWRRLKKNARQGVEKAEKNDIIVKEADTWKLWFDFYKIYTQHCLRKGLEFKNLIFFRELYEQFLPKMMVKLFVALYNDMVIAGGLFLCYDKVMAYHINASDNEYIKYSPNDLILWNAILWGRRNGFGTIDMDDTWPDPKSPHFGIHKFKDKWGGRLMEGNVYYHGDICLLGKNIIKRKNTFVDNNIKLINSLF